MTARAECDLSVSRLLPIFQQSWYRYRKFWSRKKSIGIGIGKFGLGKKVSVSVSTNLVSLEKSRYWYRKIWSRKKSFGIGLRKFGLGKKVTKKKWRNQVEVVCNQLSFRCKSLGLGLSLKTRDNFLRVSVSVSKVLVSKKKSRYRSRKYLVSKKCLGLENFGLKKKSWYRSR